jgi:hypothetical protein
MTDMITEMEKREDEKYFKTLEEKKRLAEEAIRFEKEANDKLKKELLVEHKIEENDPIVSVFDFLSARLSKTEKKFDLFQARFDESSLSKIIAAIEHQSNSIETRRNSFGVVTVSLLCLGVFGLGVFSSDIYNFAGSHLLNQPSVKVEQFDNKTTVFISKGHIETIDEDKGVSRIEVSHVASKANSKN